MLTRVGVSANGKTYNANNAALGRGLRHCAIWQSDAHFLHVSWGRINPSHDTLIISLEEDGNKGEGLNGNVQLGRRQPLPKGSKSHCDVAFERTRSRV